MTELRFLFFMAATLLFLQGKRVCLAEEKPTPNTDKEKIGLFIKELGHGEWEVREKAEKKIEDMGKDALPALEEVKNSRDLEVKMRARRLLEKIKVVAVLHKIINYFEPVKTLQADSHIVQRNQAGKVYVDFNATVRCNAEGTELHAPIKGKYYGAQMEILAVADGTYLWNENKHEGKTSVTKSTNQKRFSEREWEVKVNPAEIWNLAKEQFEFKIVEEIEVKGKKCEVMKGDFRSDYGKKRIKQLRGKLDDGRLHTLRAQLDALKFRTCKTFVDKDTGFCFRIEKVDENGTVLMEAEFSNIQLNPKLDPAIFKYIPPDKREEEKELKF